MGKEGGGGKGRRGRCQFRVGGGKEKSVLVHMCCAVSMSLLGGWGCGGEGEGKCLCRHREVKDMEGCLGEEEG